MFPKYEKNTKFWRYVAHSLFLFAKVQMCVHEHGIMLFLRST